MMKRGVLGGAVLLLGAIFFFLGSLEVVLTCPPEALLVSATFFAASVCFLFGSLLNLGEAIHG